MSTDRRHREGTAGLPETTGRLQETLDEVARLSKVVEQTADYVLITDRNGLIDYVNPAFETITGFTRSEVLGRNPSFLKSDQHGAAFYQKLWQTILRGAAFRATIVNRKKNGEQFVSEQTITPMKDASGAITHFVSVGKDITELQKATLREGQLMLARSVQQRLYPRAAPRTPGFDIAGSAITADVTGGDYYDYVPLRQRLLGIAVGDASGHGFDSTLLMAETRSCLRSIAQSHSDPARVLSAINRLLTEDTPDEYFVTLLLVSLDADNGTLRYSSAGHISGYVLDATGAVKAELKSTDVPLAIVRDHRYANGPVVALDPGDLLVLFSDGITEIGASEGKLFGAERALEAVRERVHLSARAIVQGLLNAAVRFNEGGTQDDDMTVVVCKRLDSP